MASNANLLEEHRKLVEELAHIPSSLGSPGYGLRLRQVIRTQPDPVPANANLEALKAEYESLKQQWLDSPAYQSSKQLLTEIMKEQDTVELGTAMCVGLGSLTAFFKEKPREHGFDNRPLAQFVAFESWHEILGKYMRITLPERL